MNPISCGRDEDQAQQRFLVAQRQRGGPGARRTGGRTVNGARSIA